MNIGESYKLYKNGQISREYLKDEVLCYAYMQVSRDKYIEAGDYILDFLPKVDSIIDNYKPNLASFTHYVNKHIKWFMFSFKRKLNKNRENSSAYQYQYVAEYRETFSLTEQTTEYNITENAKNILLVEDGTITKEAYRRRLEIFMLKNSRTITPTQIEILAPLIGKSTERIYQLKEKLDDKCTKRIENREYLQQRHNRLFIDITRDQKKLVKMEDGYEKEKIFKKMREKQKRKNKINDKLKRRNCGPKNSEIAQILGIPKGTVDSSIFYIKKELESLLQGLLID